MKKLVKKLKEMENGRKVYINKEEVSKQSKQIQKNVRKRVGGDTSHFKISLS